MMQLYDETAKQCSRVTTGIYSTSFASAIRLLHKDLREHIYNIYGLVRFADEIVDTFHHQDKEKLLRQFKEETFRALDSGFSLHPILHSFQLTANHFHLDRSLVISFFNSMEMDLHPRIYDREEYKTYIYGSAEVVGLMCLQVFCEGNQERFCHLKPYAQSLGAAFQKVNFLRDIKSDYAQLNRVYFPGIDFTNFTPELKQQIEDDIADDFAHAEEGIMQLPVKARFGVYVAYKYYQSLFRKIRAVKPALIFERRIRVPNYSKAMILVRAGVKNQLKLI